MPIMSENESSSKDDGTSPIPDLSEDDEIDAILLALSLILHILIQLL